MEQTKKYVINYSSLSDLGLVRDENQDAYGSLEKDWGHIFIVADGFGDKVGGKKASQIVVSSILDQFSNQPPPDPHNFVKNALSKINADILDLKIDEFDNRMMGSTCASVLIVNNIAYVSNVGDSRVYHLRNNKLIQLSKDQSLVQDLVEKGVIDPEDALSHPGKNILTEAIGSHGELNVECCQSPVAIKPGDKFLICSDGLWGLVDHSRMLSIINKNDPLNAVIELIGEARDQGGHDNITAQVIYVSDGS